MMKREVDGVKFKNGSLGLNFGWAVDGGRGCGYDVNTPMTAPHTLPRKFAVTILLAHSELTQL